MTLRGDGGYVLRVRTSFFVCGRWGVGDAVGGWYSSRWWRDAISRRGLKKRSKRIERLQEKIMEIQGAID